MPSLLHEGLIALIRERPEFAAELLREVLHIEVPKFTEARLAEASLNELIPTEYHADAVVLLVEGRPVFGCIFEAQLKEDARKRFTWPMYTVSARARFECLFVLVVITPDSATARWAAERVELGGGQTWTPLVVGPEGIPVITDAEKARRGPELAVLSLMAHGKGDTQTAVSIALAAAGSARPRLRGAAHPMSSRCSMPGGLRSRLHSASGSLPALTSKRSNAGTARRLLSRLSTRSLNRAARPAD